MQSVFQVENITKRGLCSVRLAFRILTSLSAFLRNLVDILRFHSEFQVFAKNSWFWCETVCKENLDRVMKEEGFQKDFWQELWSFPIFWSFSAILLLSLFSPSGTGNLWHIKQIWGFCNEIWLFCAGSEGWHFCSSFLFLCRFPLKLMFSFLNCWFLQIILNYLDVFVVSKQRSVALLFLQQFLLSFAEVVLIADSKHFFRKLRPIRKWKCEFWSVIKHSGGLIENNAFWWVWPALSKS